MFSLPRYTPDMVQFQLVESVWREGSKREKLLEEFCDESDKNSDEMCKAILVSMSLNLFSSFVTDEEAE
jgi:hypothetical protein